MSSGGGQFRYDRTILGYHGCDATVADRLLRGDRFILSENDYDWLGRGVYFWEYGPDRAMRFAQVTRDRDALQPPPHRPPLVTPAIVGAVLQLGHCIDLLDTASSQGLADFYPVWADRLIARGEELPANDREHRRRFRDCAVINSYIPFFEQAVEAPVDSVRGCFAEGGPIYKGSGIERESHIQVAVRRPDACILGLFRPANWA